MASFKLGCIHSIKYVCEDWPSKMAGQTIQNRRKSSWKIYSGGSFLKIFKFTLYSCKYVVFLCPIIYLGQYWLGISIFQIYKRKQTQNHAIGIYSQLFDIVVEIDKKDKGITTVEELKRLINQVRIEVVSLNRNLNSEEQVIKPWDFVSKKKYKENIDWEKEKILLKQQLEITKKDQKNIEEQLDNLEGDKK